jgi:hypothetical protein
MAKSWQQKLHPKFQPKRVVLEKAFAGVPKGATLFIGTPLLVKQFIDTIPYGRSIDPTEMRKRFARAYESDAMCPVSTGIFLRIVAEAAWEEIQQGKKIDQVTPFWRIIDVHSPLAKKLACGSSFIQRMRTNENIPNLH